MAVSYARRRLAGAMAVCILLAAGAFAADITLRPTDDVWVRGGDYATAEYGIQPGAAGYLTVKYEPGNLTYTRETFLRFDLRGISNSVDSASITLTVKSQDTNGQGLQYLKVVNDDAWTEADVCYNTRPTDYGASAIASWYAPANYETVTVDITSAVNAETDGQLSLIVYGGDNRVVNYYSKDGNTLAQRPRLKVRGSGIESPTGCGRILMEYWTGITGSSITDLTGNANYPDKPFSRDYPTVFESVASFGDNYGTRFRGYVHAPQTGNYTFYIASDNNSQLYLSSDDDPANIGSPIASVSGYTGRYQWDKYASQASSSVYLVAGQRYYVEVRHVEGSGGDHVEVGWQLPDTSYERPIGGERLSPYYDTEWIVADGNIFDRQATGHPRILASDQTFARLADEMDASPEMELRYQAVQDQADALLDVAPSTYALVAGRLLGVSREVLNRLEKLSLAYKITGDTDYLDRAWNEMDAVANFPDWHPAHFLDTAEMTMAMAIGYDWLYNDLTSAQRATIRNGIKTLGLTPGLSGYQSGAWWSTSAYNWSHVCNGGMATGAMAIYEDETAMASDILEYVLERYTLTELCPDGGWAEGAGYWSYAMRYATYMLGAMETNFGTTFGIAGRAGMPLAGFYPIYVDRPNGLVFNYGDNGTGGLTSVQEVYWMSKRFNRPEFAAWQRDQVRYAPREILWWDPRGDIPADIPLPLDKKFDNCGIAMFRGGWEPITPSFVGLKGGSNNNNHWHIDLGSVVIDGLGEAFVVDLGSNNYGTAGESDYFGADRYKYYKVRAEGHNTLVINPDADRDQEIVTDAPILNYESSTEGGQGMIDLSAAYANDATSVVRGVRMIDYKRSILIQDEISGVSGDQEVYWFMHTKADIDIVDAGQTAIFEQNGKRLWAHILNAPSGTNFTTMTATPLPTSPVPDGGQDSTDAYQKLVMHISGVANMTLAVVFVPLDLNDDPPTSLPSVTALSNWSTYAYNSAGTGFGASPRSANESVPIPGDWTPEAGAVAFQLYSGTNNNQQIPITFLSENESTEGIDYYYKSIYADWIGWKQFVFPLSDFSPTRSPLGWDQLTGIVFRTSGWGATVLPDSVLKVADVQTVPTGTMFGQSPAQTFDLFFLPPLDWDISKEYVGFDLYSKAANNQRIVFNLMSENPEGVPEGPDYYSKSIYADWTGWKHFCIPLSSMGTSRQPRGLDDLDEVRFYTNGWGTTVMEDTLLSLDNFGTEVGGECFGYDPAESTDAEPDLPTGWLPYGSVTFDLYSAVANGQTINVIFFSQNPGTGGDDYYIYTLTADWTGWKSFDIPMLDFTTVGTPLGWDQVTDIVFDTNSYAGASLLTGTYLSVRDIDTTLDGGNFGASPMGSTGYNAGVPSNWVGYGYLAFDIYSQENNGQQIMIVGSAENAEDPAGWDYYSKKITVDWSGWKHFEIPLYEFGTNRNPLGWEDLDYVSFSTTGWSMTLLDDTYLSVKNVENKLDGHQLGASPSPSASYTSNSLSNWTGYGYLSFDLYSDAANNQIVKVVCDSENTSGTPEGWDYYIYSITVDWEGWRHFDIPLSSFASVRDPLGWDQINYVGFRTTGWTCILLDDTHLSVDGLANTLEGTNFGATPSPSATANVGVPADWDHTDGEISFSLYSENANNQIVGVNCYSENPSGVPEGPDYYRYTITVDWTGWQDFTIPFASFSNNRQPLGWDQLTGLTFSSSGWSTTLYDDTHLSVKDVRSGD